MRTREEKLKAQVAATHRWRNKHKHEPEYKLKMSILRKRHYDKTKNNPEKILKKKESQLTFRKNNPEYYLWNGARWRARNKNMEFTILLSDVVIPEKCPITGLVLTSGVGKGKREDTSATLDRVDNSKGYTKSNTAVISHYANRTKSNMSIEHIYNLYRYIHEDRS